MRSALFVAAGVALVGVAASCHGGRHDPEDVKGFIDRRVEKTLNEIDANDTQRQAVNAAKERILTRMLAGRKSHQELAAELLGEWEKDTPDMEKVRRLIDAQLEARRQNTLASLDDVEQIHDVLTPAQRAELAQKVREHMQD